MYLSTPLDPEYPIIRLPQLSTLRISSPYDIDYFFRCLTLPSLTDLRYADLSSQWAPASLLSLISRPSYLLTKLTICIAHPFGKDDVAQRLQHTPDLEYSKFNATARWGRMVRLFNPSPTRQALLGPVWCLGYDSLRLDMLMGSISRVS